ncbi:MULTISPECIES: response regulator transcription factor [Rubrivivax]|uniref:Response regulator n=1 Tax=Rubrivivax benzoatilyticus TaxID=316997 RepID=A0ABX0HRR5_9BURK|nr:MULTISPECIES: response regulator [Rubrivivax]MCD0420634.1 response regulator [Rubrivivax sp. JA1024]EGJ09280.1 response regulator receiver protein [Rubrivivax benzoatilyticus JA2 = ATCC BAA-35]MCC9595681.1 response regulator [Rubrivivax sp. JA1055]MCC9646812.1 response regulator [Rubrivivax sp. JA1029]NHK97742.1 response regulator [Rubrivivax benzoatilyticus]
MKTVLLADAEANSVIPLEFLMKREGWRVLVARDGIEALDTARREHPDLLLMDVVMPGRSGFEVLQALRADEACATTKCLLLSARCGETDVAQGLGLGADAYVAKPFSTRELAERVRQLLS